MGTAYDNEVYVSDIYVVAAQYLAWKHIQDRDGSVLPELPEWMEGCEDFDWTFEQRETYYDPVPAIQGLVSATQPNRRDKALEEDATKRSARKSLPAKKTAKKNIYNAMPSDKTSPFQEPRRDLVNLDIIPVINTTVSGNNNNEIDAQDADDEGEPLLGKEDFTLHPHPFAVVGAAYSYVTVPLAIVGSALELPMISGSATSAALDENPLQRKFARTIPTNAGDSHAAMLYYESIGVGHVAVIYIQDAWGNYYHADLKREASEHNISLQSIPYTENEESIQEAMERLKATQYRYVFAIMYEWKTVLEIAYDCGVVGTPEYSWIAAEIIYWTDPEFALNRTSGTLDDDVEVEHYERDYKHGRALNGIGQLIIDVPYHDRFSNAMIEFAALPTLRQDFINKHSDAAVWENLRDADWTPPDSSIFQQMNYDAVIAAGLAACQTPGLFTAEEFYDTLRGVTFEGASGNVTFASITGTRNVDSVRYRLDTIYVSESRSDEETLRFDSHLAAIMSQGHVQHLQPFRYADNTTNPPPALPPIEYEYNLIPVGAQIYGWIVSGCGIGLSIFFLAWTYVNRRKFVVQASQPIFLIQLCLGTLLMASAIIPMSFQATDGEVAASANLQRQLNMACMSVPWLVMLGLVVTLSALSSKAWRLNQLMKAGMQMRRIEVQPSDVMGPFAVLMSINLAMLLCWTILAPLQYVRVQKMNVDKFGRNVESYAVCQSQTSNSLYFLIPILVANVVGLLLTSYQSYKGRNYATAISESRYLAMSALSLLESLLLGVPILLVLRDNPTAFFVVRCTILSIACMAILLPVLVPKYLYRNTRENDLSSRRGNARASTNFNIIRNKHSPGANSGIEFRTAPRGQAKVSEETLAGNSEWGKMKIKRLQISGVSVSATGSS